MRRLSSLRKVNPNSMKRFFLRSRALHLLLTVAASSLIAIFFGKSQLGTTVERETLDLRMRVASGSRKPDSSVVIAAIDQKSLTYFQKIGVAWPWPHELYGILLDYLHEGGAKAVILDIDFSQPDMDRLNMDAVESDSTFASSISRSGNVILISVLTGQGDSADAGGSSIESRFFLDGTSTDRSGPGFTSCVAPLTEFQKGAAGVGAANYIVDVDGVARRIPLLFKLDNRSLPQLSLAAYAVGNNLSAGQLRRFIGTVPVEKNGDYLINWYGKGGPRGVFKYYSMSALIISAVQLKQGMAPEIPPTFFRNKYVFVGGSAIGLLDFVSTPFASMQPFPGAEIHATILSNFLEHDYLKELPSAANLFVIIAASLIAAGAFFGMKRASVSSAVIVISCGLYLAAAFLLMSASRLALPLVSPEISALTAFAFAGVLSYVTEGRQKRELRKLMNRYISPDVVDEISADPDTIDFKGKEVEATVFFSDIRDFTSVSERLQPRELVENLNEYFTLATEVVLNNGAMLDKYIGDAIMAVFGAPLERKDHAALACLTAIQMQNILSDYYSRRQGDKPVFVTRIGLNTGKMVIGNIGSTRRTDYTAIGDSVNLASRLEGVNKQFGTRIMISESTYGQSSNVVEAREIDLVTVKGKDLPVRIFELLCEKGKLSRADSAAYEMFHEGLVSYRQREWKRAETLFTEVLRSKTNDGPSLTYIARCKALSETGVPDGWDGVFRLKTK